MNVYDWINVNDELPNEYEEVLIWVSSEAETKIGWLINGNKIDYEWIGDDMSSYKSNEVTHWMPLPEAPSEK